MTHLLLHNKLANTTRPEELTAQIFLAHGKHKIKMHWLQYHERSVALCFPLLALVLPKWQCLLIKLHPKRPCGLSVLADRFPQPSRYQQFAHQSFMTLGLETAWNCQ